MPFFCKADAGKMAQGFISVLPKWGIYNKIYHEEVSQDRERGE